MINALEYETTIDGVTRRIRADKNVLERNAWHLKSIDGNGLPPVSVLGSNSYKIAGKSYQGITIDGREITAELYADGFSGLGLQNMMNEACRVVSLASEELGVLKLTNSAGDTFRISAKCTAFEETLRKHRTSLFNAVFDCPFSFFEDDVKHITNICAVTGGKEYPLNRPYTFSQITSSNLTNTVNIVNDGDIAAPVTIKINGSTITALTITNNTTGEVITVSGAPSVGGIEICTDINNLYAKFANGNDAIRYVSLSSRLSDFVLAPCNNEITVAATASSIAPAGTVIEHRGRYTLCL